MKKFKTILYAALIFFLASTFASANPGIVVTVDPRESSITQGTSDILSVRVESITNMEELVVLSIVDPRTGWIYTFSENSFVILPGQIIDLDLEVIVPQAEKVDSYQHLVRGDAYLPNWEFLGSIESSPFYIIINVIGIPEFPTVAVPVIAALGLMLVMTRRKERNS